MKYTVVAGDTLYGISRKNNISTQEILALNGWSSPPPLQIGQEIIVGKVTNNTPAPSSSNSSNTYTVAKGDSLYAIGRKYGVSPSEILTLNGLSPSDGLYIGQVLNIPSSGSSNQSTSTSTTTVTPSPKPVSNSGQKTHTVTQGESLYAISRKYNTTPQAILEENGLGKNAPIYIGQELTIPSASKPTSTPSNNTTVTSTPTPQEKIVYTVQQGDTLYQISRKVGLSPQQILALNGMDASTPIYIGQELKVKGVPKVSPEVSTPTPNETVKTHTVQRGESLYAIGRKYGCSPAEILAANNMAIDATIYIGQTLKMPSKSNAKPVDPITPPPVVRPTPTPPAPTTNYRVYTVQSGDYISKIAKKFNITPQALVAANKLPQGRIYVGQQLMIPSTSQQSNTSQGTTNSIRGQQGRSIYQLSKVDGKSILARGLTGAIGSSYKMAADDVHTVQQRLVQLGSLSSIHNENAQSLAQRYGGSVPGNAIPKTLAAIKNLQNKYRLNWWVESPARVQMMGTNVFKYGEIQPNDITFKFLREFTKFKLQFPHPITGNTEVAEFTNFVRSGYNQYYDGVGYVGKSLPSNVPLKVYTDVGLSTTLAQAMQVVSSHEGNFDAINSYDKAFFSYGFIQFAGGGRGLAPVIARMKVSQPALFKAIFQSAGIDVTYTTRNNDIHQGELIIQFPNGQTLKGIEAEKALRGDHQLYGPFIRAAFHPDLIKAQIEQSVKAYAKPALGIKLNIQTSGFRSSTVPLTDFINSAMGLGFAIDMTVNKWIVKTGQMFSDAINTIARKRGYASYEQLALIDEREVIQEIVNKEGPGDKRVADRGNSMMKSGLSFAKSPSKGSGMIA
ncbi:muramidase family protein [Flammeovirga aprica]|uniref:LysM peptidoglycan-binding domain-containing protein n=1 Tax=Flammeovirga aprica JL-4 TaxID=694437 RepID=A0A7X9RZE8_9BACT|nr:LysM peptidoglycan-binding domain-containing protein [Flammeovirga aprica]NME71437.1 LysM peptidoglycan-binding domain-containing protein [Flammeovirga aprica JL-4]